MVKTPTVVRDGEQFILSSLSPGRAQKRLALAVVLALVIAFFITAGPLSTLHPGQIDGFIPAYATAMFVIDSITAVLLFAQFSILRSRALLVIASGYLFTALIVIPWMLTFPGVFTPGGLLGAGLQTTTWLYILWHAGFAMFVIAYALLKDADPAKRVWQGSAGAAICSSVAMTAAVVCAATFLFTVDDRATAPRHARSSAFFYPLALCCRVCGAVEHPCAHCALDPAAFGARSVADGGDVRVRDRDWSNRVSRSGPLHRRLVCRPGLRARVRQSRADCPGVRDHERFTGSCSAPSSPNAASAKRGC